MSDKLNINLIPEFSPEELSEQLDKYTNANKEVQEFLKLGNILNISNNQAASVISIPHNKSEYYTDSGVNSYASKKDKKQFQTNFQQCSDIYSLVGRGFSPTPETLEHQIKIIRSEWEELLESQKTFDLKQIRDDVVDILFTVYGLAARLGFPADQDFKALCNSQYSKFDTSEADAILTKEKYNLMGIETYYKKDFSQRYYVTFSAIDQYDKDQKFYPKDKWLKSIHFKEPNFT